MKILVGGTRAVEVLAVLQKYGVSWVSVHRNIHDWLLKTAAQQNLFADSAEVAAAAATMADALLEKHTDFATRLMFHVAYRRGQLGVREICVGPVEVPRDGLRRAGWFVVAAGEWPGADVDYRVGVDDDVDARTLEILRCLRPAPTAAKGRMR